MNVHSDPPDHASRRRWLVREIGEWEREGLIDASAADRLRLRYSSGTEAAQRPRSHVLLAVLGVALIAAGVILVLAHNWELLGRPARAGIAFGGLIFGQLMCGWTLWRHRGSPIWREASATALTGAIAACLALIAQTYNIPGTLESFLLTWGLLLLPLPYIMGSGASFVAIHGVLMFWVLNGYGGGGHTGWIYMAGFAATLPYLLMLPTGSQKRLLRWIVALIPCITLSALGAGGWWVPTYAFFFGVLWLIGDRRAATVWHHRPFALIGSAGLFVLALLLTFSGSWPTRDQWGFDGASIAAIVLFAVATVGLAIRHFQPHARWVLQAGAPLVISIGALLAVRADPWSAALLSNLLVLALGAAYMRHGYRALRPGLFNSGFLLVSVLLFLRFLDEDVGMLARAGTFIVLGTTLLLINARLARKNHAQAGAADADAPHGGTPPPPPLPFVAAFSAISDRALRRHAVIGPLFVLMIMAQLAVPGQMLIHREGTLRKGTVFRFETAPVDPYDPFRGRYVALNFVANRETFPAESLEAPPQEWKPRTAFVLLETDDRGFARLAELRDDPPESGHYLKVSVRRRYDGTLHINLPFDRYYMNEVSAPEAERIFRRPASPGAEVESYAEVHVRDGHAVLGGLYVDSQPIESLVAASR